jgi:hypothetical protein
MRILSSALTVGLLLISASVAQNSPAPLRWSEGAPNASSEVKNDIRIEGLKTDDIHIFVSLAEIKETEYNRVWVQVSNHSKGPIDFNPEAAVLVDQKGKAHAAEIPEKAANSIQKFGEAKSQELASAHCTMMSAMNCQPTNAQMQVSKQVLAFSGQQAQWVRENGLKQKTLAPGDEEQGAIIFKKEKKRAQYVLRIPVGTQIFEFPLTADNKAPSYD